MFNIYEPDTKFNKIFMFIGNTITVVTGLFAIISWIVKEIIKDISDLPPILNNILTAVLHFCVVVFIIAFISLFIRIIYIAFRNKSESFYMQRKLAEFLHQQLIHNVRNNIVELEPLYERLEKYSKDKNNDAISQCYELEVKELKDNLKGYIDELAEYL